MFFYGIIQCAKWLAILGSLTYDFLIYFNRYINFFRNKRGSNFGIDHYKLATDFFDKKFIDKIYKFIATIKFCVHKIENLSKFIKIYQNLSKFIKIYQKFIKIYKNLSKFIKIYQNLSKKLNF